MLTLFSLNNPLTAPIMIMAACFALGFIIGYTVLRIGRSRFAYRIIDNHTKGALRGRDAHIRRLNEEVAHLKEANASLRGKIGVMSLFLGKAVTEARIDE